MHHGSPQPPQGRPSVPTAPDASFLGVESARVLWHIWRQGVRPDLDRFLDNTGRLSAEQLAAVVRVDQRERWLAGERVPAEEYLRRYPQLRAAGLAVDIIYGECLVREALGETPPVEEFLARFPEFDQALKSPSVNNPTAARVVPPDPPLVSTCHEQTPQFHEAPTVSPKPPEAVPTVPGYELSASLGGGGMGVVYKAKELATGETVAVKLVREEQLERVDSVRRWRREVQAALRLDHPHIVRVRSARQAGDQYFLVMEYVPGLDLQRLVTLGGPLPLDTACEFARQAATGLGHIHERGLVHRDIKPANVMVTLPAAPCADGRPPTASGPDLTLGMIEPYRAKTARVKILDLGLARLQESDGHTAVSTLTHAGAVMGTPDYMAPEQWDNAHTADIRADLYSLGCTLYFALSGQPPFPGGTMVQKLDRHRSAVPLPIERFRPDVPPALSKLLRRCLAKRPSERFQTPQEAADALEELLQRGLLGSGPSAAGSDDGTAAVGEVRRFVGHTGVINALAVSADGQLLATAGDDGSVRLWEVKSGRETARLLGHTGAVKAVVFTPDAACLLSAGADRVIRVWRPPTGQPVRVLDGHTDVVRSLAVSPDGRSVLSAGGDRVVRRWSIATGKRISKMVGHTGDVCTALFSPCGEIVVSAGWDKTVRLWEAATGRQMRSLGGSFSDWQWLVVLGACFSPDGKLIALAGSDHLVRICLADDGREIGRLDGHADAVNAVAFSPTGERLVTAGRDRTVRYWEFSPGSAGREVHRFEGDQKRVTAVAFLPDGRFAVSAGGDGTARVWRLPG